MVTEDWYFVSHRLNLAEKAIKEGFKVGLLTKKTVHGEMISSKGVDLFNWSIRRGNTNLLLELKSILEVFSVVKRFSPDLVYSVATKPIIYSSIACKFLGVQARVNTLGGLGFIFSSKKIIAKIIRSFVIPSFRLLLKGKSSVLILQNTDDQKKLLSLKVINEERTRLIKGSGVDVNLFYPEKKPNGLPVVLLPSRFLWDKGIGEFVESAKILKEKGLKARFVLAGKHDEENPENIPISKIKEWVEEGLVENWGFVKNMSKAINKSSIVCLPSYREGLPKCLLEAASCARPIVTTDVPGCREIVLHGKNGLLVEAKSIESLVTALNKLLTESNLREEMGQKGREMVLKEFSEDLISNQVSEVWRQVLN